MHTHDNKIIRQLAQAAHFHEPERFRREGGFKHVRFAVGDDFVALSDAMTHPVALGNILHHAVFRILRITQPHVAPDGSFRENFAQRESFHRRRTPTSSGRCANADRFKLAIAPDRDDVHRHGLRRAGRNHLRGLPPGPGIRRFPFVVLAAEIHALATIDVGRADGAFLPPPIGTAANPLGFSVSVIKRHQRLSNRGDRRKKRAEPADLMIPAAVEQYRKRVGAGFQEAGDVLRRVEGQFLVIALRRRKQPSSAGMPFT